MSTHKINKKIAVGAIAFIAVTTAIPYMAYAALTANSTLTQAVNAGVISTDIRDAGGSIVGSPTFAMSAATVSNSQETVTGTFGTNTQRVTVDNPGGANNGWTLTWNATTPGTEVWTNGTDDYPYNNSIANGRLTVNPVVGTLTPVVGSSTGMTLGTSTSFTSTNPITILTAASNSDDVWNGYVTGVGLIQTIPASQPAGSYSISMTQTVTAN